jgi:hypothetical protein
MTPSGAMEVGSGSARLFLYSSEDPSVEIGGVGYKLYTEHFPPPSVAAGLLKVTTFTASQTWTKQAGTKKIIVEVIGGGGGGGATVSSANGPAVGAGGGAGGYAKALIDVSSISTIAMTIGAAGASNGAGGTTTLTGYIQCQGGAAGANTSVSNTTTAYQDVRTPNLATVTFLASPPSTVTPISSNTGRQGGAGVINLATARSGVGADSEFGSGGRAAAATSVGNAGAGYGTGGSGGAGIAAAAIQAGGVGGSGAVIIWEYS